MTTPCTGHAAEIERDECPNCFEGKSDMDHTCSICGGSALLAHIRSGVPDHIRDDAKTLGTCNMGIGCDEAGVCFAKANNNPEMFPRAPAPAGVPMPEPHDHPDFVGGIVWSRCELDWIRTYGDAREAAGYARGRAEADKLAHTLMMCRETFRKYADLHSAKGTDKGRAKAAANMRIVSICDAALRGEVKP